MTGANWLTGRNGQALAVGIAVLGLALIWFGVIDPARTWFADRALRLDQRRTLLHRMQEIATTLPSLRAEAAGKSARDEVNGAIMLPGASDAVAAADLQERVQKMTVSAGANLTAVETLPVSQSGKWHKVSLRISLNAPWPVLMDLLRSIELSSMRILVDDVRFHSVTVVSRPTVLPIQASMVVYGFRPAEAGTGT
jgi:hypothetical protein